MLKQKFQSELKSMIVKQIGLNKSRANFIAHAVEGVLMYESVLQKKIAQSLSNGKSLTESSIRRVERFFSDSHISIKEFSCMISKALNINKKVRETYIMIATRRHPPIIAIDKVH